MDNIRISIITSLYRGEKYIEYFFRNLVGIDNLEEVELIMVHNDPTALEKDVITKYKNLVPHFIYMEVSLEAVYVSWNRAIKIANGKYLAMWNIDDRRTSNSLELQADFLDENINVALVTGDYYKVFNYGNNKGILKKDPATKNIINGIVRFNNGCFLMWRKNIHKTIGYFDEQLNIVADHDFWIRVSLKYKIGRIDDILGYYLRESNSGISKKNISQNNVELNIVKLRYYRYFIFNIYHFVFNTLFGKNKILVKRIKNYGKMKQLYIFKKVSIISIFVSIFLFWFPLLKKQLIEVKYKIYKDDE